MIKTLLYRVMLLLVAIAINSQFVVAQELIYRGTVTDAKDNTVLSGASIKTNYGNATVTDNQGHFSIKAKAGSELTVTLIGYSTTKVTLGSQSQVQIALQSSENELEEAVVIGYGTVKRSSVTASVSKIENKNLDQVPNARPESALQGRLAGVNISQTRSAPGSAPVIRIRGVGSISAGNDPLLVVDGFPGASWANINSNDIATIEVLKDASAAAIYGSRAAGGVIIITTRSGKSGKPQLNINAFAGVSTPMLHKDFMNTQEYYDAVVKYQNREYVFVGGNPSLPLWGDNNRPAAYRVNPDIINGNNVIWQDAITKTAPFQSYDLSVNGGNESVKYYVSGVYKDQQGTVVTTGYKSYGARASADIKVNECIDLGMMINPTYQTSRVSPNGMDAFNKYPPFVAIQNEDGTYPKARDYWSANVSSQANPMGILMGTNNRGATMSTLGNLYASIKIADGLVFKTTGNVNIINNSNDNFQATWGSNTGVSSGAAAESRSITLLNENTLNYTNTFAEDHDFGALVGASYQKSTSRLMNMVAMPGSFNNNIIETLNNAQVNPSGTYTSKSIWGMVSYFGRVNYGYKDKYLLSASVRTDGSSRFGPDNKWGLFPSASVAWRVGQEEFMQNQNLVSDMKLRASFGNTGNMNIGNFAYLGTFQSGLYTVNDVATSWQAQSSFGNNSLGWEKTSEIDLGVDLAFLKNRIMLTADWYRKRTKNLLYNVSVPGITGFTNSLSNVGEVENKGFEVELTTKNFTGDFKWETNLNFSTNKNTVIDLGGVNERMTSISYGMNWLLRVGEPMFSYYGYDHIGVIQTPDQLASLPILAGEKVGNPIYEDVNGDGVINPSDRKILGSFMPKSYWGMTNNLSYKNFDFSMTIQASLGAKMYNFENQFYQGSVLGNMRKSLVEGSWWSSTDQGDGYTPALSLSQLNYNANSDFYIEDASFLAIRNINVGYKFSDHLAKKIGAKNFRIFTSINNVAMLTKAEFNAYNPEGYTGGEVSGISSTPGYNTGSEPINRVYTFGINLSF